MPQNPIPIAPTTSNGASVPLQSDVSGNLLVGNGSLTTKNVTAAAVIKTGAGRVAKVINNAGTAGFTLSDLASTSGAAAANEIFTISTTTVGQVITLDVPFTTGLAVTTVGASGRLVVVYD